MSKGKFDTLIHAPNRLQICARLAVVAEIEFKTLTELLDVSDSVMSKQLKALEEAGYVFLEKRPENGRQRTWLSLTKDGRTAFNGHVEALKEIVG